VYVDIVRCDLGGKVITGEASERVVSRNVSYKYGSDSDWLWECGCLNFEQGRHCTCNVTLWRVRVTIVAQMQQYVVLADFRYSVAVNDIHSAVQKFQD